MKSLRLLLAHCIAVLLVAGLCAAEPPPKAEERGDVPIVFRVVPNRLPQNPTPAQLEAVYHQAWRQVADSYYDFQRIYSEFGAWQHRYDGKLKTLGDLDDALKCMVDSLHDRWTVYSGPGSTTIGAEPEAVRGSLGMALKRRKDGAYVIEHITYRSSVHQSPLLEGDEIVSIGDVPLRPLDEERVKDLLVGPIGAGTVAIALVNGAEQRVPLSFGNSEPPRVETKVLPGNIGYVRIPDFQSDRRSSELFQALMKLSLDVPIKGIVLDLRNNPGGKLGVTNSVASMWIDRATVVTTRTRKGRAVQENKFSILPVAPYDVERASKAQRQLFGLLQRAPLVVVVNGSTASGAEILTGCLKDSGRALAVIGTATFGKAVGYSQTILPNGGKMTITSLSYVTPSGFDLSGRGIAPTKIISQGRNKKVDNVLATALVMLRQKNRQ